MAAPNHAFQSLPGHLLRNRNFLLLWGAYAISAMGDHLSEMAILKTLNAISRDVDVTPLSARMTFMFFLPFFVLSPITGVLADWLPRRALMVAADFVRCLIMLSFAFLVAFSAGWGPWGPFVPLALVGVFAAMFSPARSALLPTLIRPDQLVRANGMIAGLGIIATMLAMKIGGYLAQSYEPVVAFRIDAGTFLASAVLLLMIRPPRAHADYQTTKTLAGGLRAVADGFLYVRAHGRVMELIAVMALVWFCGALVNSGLPAIVRDTYQGDYQTISSYRALIGLGFLLGAAILSILGDALKSEIAVSWGLLGVAFGIALVTASAFLPLPLGWLSWVGAVGVVIAGMFAVATMAGTSALLQRTVSDRFRGRVFGANDLCSIGMLLLATGALGMEHGGRVDPYVRYIFAAVAVVTGIAGLITFRIRLHRGQLGAALTFGENLNDFICKFWWRMKLVGRSTVPRTGAVIIASNHTSAPDPLFLCAAAPYRAIAFMIAQEFARWPIVRFFVRVMECIPVTRAGQDTAAFKKALRHLQAGKALAIFIEGRIMKPGEAAAPRDGVAMLARQTEATVVPAHISGTKYHSSVLLGLLSRHRAQVRLGKAIDLRDLFGEGGSDRKAVHAATQRIYAAIQALAPSDEGRIGAETHRKT